MVVFLVHNVFLKDFDFPEPHSKSAKPLLPAELNERILIAIYKKR